MSDPYEVMIFFVGVAIGGSIGGFSTYMFNRSTVDSQYQHCNKQCATYVTEKDELLKCVDGCVKARDVMSVKE